MTTDLSQLASQLLAQGPHRVEVTPRRVRALFNRVYVFDTIAARHVWEHPHYPQFYVPASSVAKGARLEKSSKAVDGDGAAFLATLKVGDKATDRVLIFDKGPLAGLVRIEFGAMDSWFEEDQEIYLHPKDPYKRIEILPSTRTITAKVGGRVIAESSSPMLLQETTLPMRYYLPKTSLNWQFITNSDTTTVCPYKGQANYYNVVIDGKEYRDMFWWYKYPTPESVTIAGKVAPYNEKMEIYIDGVRQ